MKEKKRRVSFVVPLIVLIGLVLITAFTLQAMLVTITLEKEITKTQETNFKRITQAIARSIDMNLTGNEGTLAGYAKALGLMAEASHKTRPNMEHRLDKENYRKKGAQRDLIPGILADVIASDPSYYNAFVASASGVIVASSDVSVLGVSIADRRYFQEITQKNKGVYTSRTVLVSRLTGRGVIVQAVPIKWYGQVIGILAAVLDLQTAGDDIVLGNKVGRTGYPFVLDENGIVLIHPLNEVWYKNVVELIPSLQAVLDNPAEVQTASYVYNGGKKEGVFVRMPYNGWIVCLTRSQHEAFQTVYTMRRILLLTSIVFIFFTALTIFVFIRIRLVKSVARVEHLIQLSGEGDLTQRGTVKGRDEIANMSRLYNAMLNSLTNFFKKLDANLGSLENVGYELSLNTDETAGAVNEIQVNIEHALEQIERQEESVSVTVTSVEEITQNIKSLDKNIDHQIDDIQQGSSAIEEMITQIRAVSASTEKAENLMTTLSASSMTGKDNINNVSTMVTDIAEKSKALESANKLIAGIAAQTNLLAMNAAIEAAHAGDAGKGFAVVADEIRTLAEQATMQSSQVKQTITGINKSIHDVVEGSRTSKLSFEEILRDVEKMSYITNEIKLAMEEQVGGSTEVLNSLTEMKNAGNEVAAGSQEMTKGNKVILEAVTQLSRISSEAFTAMKGISAGMDEINKAVLNIMEMGKINKKSIDSVRQEVSFYKLR